MRSHNWRQKPQGSDSCKSSCFHVLVAPGLLCPFPAGVSHPCAPTAHYLCRVVAPQTGRTSASLLCSVIYSQSLPPHWSCGLQNNSPPETHTDCLTTENLEYVTLHGKRDFARLIKLRIWSWEDDPGLSRWPSTVTRVLIRGRQEGPGLRRSDDGRKGQKERLDMLCCWLRR